MKLSIFIIQCYNQGLENTDPTPGMLIVVGNKRKGRISKRMFQKKKQSMPNFPKNEHFLPADTHTDGSDLFCLGPFTA